LPGKFVVFLAGTDPKPDDQIAVLLCHRAIVISDSDLPDVSNKRLELHRWMKRIVLPNSKLVSRKTLNVGW
jgi:hypothetical protein